MANGNGKKKNGNGGKKTKPIKPPTSRKGKKTTRRTEPIQSIAPADGKIANKLITNKKYRDSAFSGFLKGITFGLYKP